MSKLLLCIYIQTFIWLSYYKGYITNVVTLNRDCTLRLLFAGCYYNPSLQVRVFDYMKVIPNTSPQIYITDDKRILRLVVIEEGWECVDMTYEEIIPTMTKNNTEVFNVYIWTLTKYWYKRKRRTLSLNTIYESLFWKDLHL